MKKGRNFPISSGPARGATPSINIPDDPDSGDPDTPDGPDQPDEPGLPQTGQQWLLVGLLAVAGVALVVTGLLQKTRYRGKHEA